MHEDVYNALLGGCRRCRRTHKKGSRGSEIDPKIDLKIDEKPIGKNTLFLGLCEPKVDQNRQKIMILTQCWEAFGVKMDK